MGQKVNPIGLRVGVIRTWDSRWFAKGNLYAQQVHEDFKLRKYIKAKLKHAGVARIEMERAANKVKIVISTARPGVVIGKKGTGIDQLKAEVQKLTKNEVFLNIHEVRKPDMDAQLISENIALQLEKRISWRRAVKKAIQAGIKVGVRGIKIKVGGRLDGAEIARVEWYNEKSVPLHTLRADIDYGTAEALTTYGLIGVKVWVYKGDILTAKEVSEGSRA
ncbi:MAG: 30S ribosomal protein S3 [Bdellovibrionota bacterium]